MSKESKATPREWYLSKYATEFCNMCGGATPEDDKYEARIHVIEYSALLAERAKSARLLDALKKQKSYLIDLIEKVKAPSAYMIDEAAEAIADYNQSEGGE